MFKGFEIIDKAYDEEVDKIDVNDKYAYLKAFGLGASKGYIKGASIAYIPLVISCMYWKHKVTGRYFF